MITLAARFYGWTWDTIRKMKYRTFRRFMDYIPELQAREKLLGAMVAAWPHLTNEGRRDIQSAWLVEAGIDPKEAGVGDRTLKGSAIRDFIRAGKSGSIPKPE